MAEREALTAEIVRNLLDYDSETGDALWRDRPVEMFEDGEQSAAHKCARWNARYAGTIVGAPDGDGYLEISIFGNSGYKLHRLAWLIMTGEWPKNEIGHRNLNRTDNRWCNLRPATASESRANRVIQRNNKSGFKGVSWHKGHQKWRATIKKDGRKIHLGYFDTAESAHAAYCSAAHQFFGEFARVA